MKRILTLTFALLPAAALADPGGHPEFSLTGALVHVVSEPDHLFAIASLAAAAVGVVLWRRERATQKVRRNDPR